MPSALQGLLGLMTCQKSRLYLFIQVPWSDGHKSFLQNVTGKHLNFLSSKNGHVAVLLVSVLPSQLACRCYSISMAAAGVQIFGKMPTLIIEIGIPLLIQPHILTW
jgi:hypothetical protein